MRHQGKYVPEMIMRECILEVQLRGICYGGIYSFGITQHINTRENHVTG